MLYDRIQVFISERFFWHKLNFPLRPWLLSSFVMIFDNIPILVIISWSSLLAFFLSWALAIQVWNSTKNKFQNYCLYNLQKLGFTQLLTFAVFTSVLVRSWVFHQVREYCIATVQFSPSIAHLLAFWLAIVVGW